MYRSDLAEVARRSRRGSIEGESSLLFLSINVPLRLRFLLFVPIGHRDIARSLASTSVYLPLSLSLSNLESIDTRLDNRISIASDPFDASAREGAGSFGDSRSSPRDKYEPVDWSLPFRLIRRLSPRPSVPYNCLIVFL